MLITSTTISIMMQIRVQFYAGLVYWSRFEDVTIESHLKSANKSIVNLVIEKLGAMVLHAGPSPHILVVAVVPAKLEHTSSDCPHSHAENEPADCE